MEGEGEGRGETKKQPSVRALGHTVHDCTDTSKPNNYS